MEPASEHFTGLVFKLQVLTAASGWGVVAHRSKLCQTKHVVKVPRQWHVKASESSLAFFAKAVLCDSLLAHHALKRFMRRVCREQGILACHSATLCCWVPGQHGRAAPRQGRLHPRVLWAL